MLGESKDEHLGESGLWWSCEARHAGRVGQREAENMEEAERARQCDMTEDKKTISFQQPTSGQEGQILLGGQGRKELQCIFELEHR